MKFRTLKPMIYGGISYEVDAEVDIQEKLVIKDKIHYQNQDTDKVRIYRVLIAEINGKTEKSEESIETENTEETDKKDTKNKKK